MAIASGTNRNENVKLFDLVIVLLQKFFNYKFIIILWQLPTAAITSKIVICIQQMNMKI